jgi:hypothetical protein
VAALAQEPTSARALATPANAGAVKNFLTDAPDHFAYTALRFLLAVAPALPPGDEGREAVEAAVELPLARRGGARISLVVAQFLAALPIDAAWDAILMDCEVGTFVSFLKMHCSTDDKIMIVARTLEARCE